MCACRRFGRVQEGKGIVSVDGFRWRSSRRCAKHGGMFQTGVGGLGARHDQWPRGSGTQIDGRPSFRTRFEVSALRRRGCVESLDKGSSRKKRARLERPEVAERRWGGVFRRSREGDLERGRGEKDPRLRHVGGSGPPVVLAFGGCDDALNPCFAPHAPRPNFGSDPNLGSERGPRCFVFIDCLFARERCAET